MSDDSGYSCDICEACAAVYRAEGAAAERARTEKTVKALFVEDADEGPYLDALRAVYTALFLSAAPVPLSPSVGEDAQDDRQRS